jgi:hypothetical protein
MKENLGVIALVALLGAHADSSWPPFLPPAESFSPALAAGVERVWNDPTLSRSVEGEPAPVPFPVYVAFVDSPDVMAAAARHLKLAKYEIRTRGDDTYEVDDHDGSRGTYQVLVHENGRRVVFSRGSHTGPILGTIRGSALTVMEFDDQAGRTMPRLTAYVLIDNRVAAALARVLQVAFGHLADAKLTEGFKVTARVASWALKHPDEFCDWLENSPVPPARRELLLDALPHCRTAAASIRLPRP